MNYLPQLFLLERNKRARGNTGYGGDIEQSVAHGLQFRCAPLQPVNRNVHSPCGRVNVAANRASACPPAGGRTSGWSIHSTPKK